MPFPWLQALSGVTSIAMNFIQNKANERLVDKQNAGQMKLAEYGYNKDLEMWNRQNEYNSPIEQMQRLKSAGLNPALVYGNGAVGNSAGTIPHYNTPTLNRNQVRYDPINILGLINSYQDLKYKTEVTNQVKENTKLAIQNQAIKEKEIVGKDIDNTIKNTISMSKALDYKKAKNLEQYSYDLAKANLEHKYNELQKQIYDIQAAPYKVESSRLERDLLESNVNMRKIGVTDSDNVFLRLLMRNLPQSLQKKLSTIRDY